MLVSRTHLYPRCEIEEDDEEEKQEKLTNATNVKCIPEIPVLRLSAFARSASIFCHEYFMNFSLNFIKINFHEKITFTFCALKAHSDMRRARDRRKTSTCALKWFCVFADYLTLTSWIRECDEIYNGEHVDREQNSWERSFISTHKKTY